MVFGVGLEHFFVETEGRPLVAVTRKKDRLRLPNRPAEEPPSYFFESLNFAVTNRKWDIYYAEFPPAAKPSDLHQHADAEFIYVIDGGLVVTIGGKDIVLEEGDSVYFDSRVAHSYRLGDLRKPASVIVVIVPELD